MLCLCVPLPPTPPPRRPLPMFRPSPPSFDGCLSSKLVLGVLPTGRQFECTITFCVVICLFPRYNRFLRNCVDPVLFEWSLWTSFNAPCQRQPFQRGSRAWRCFKFSSVVCITQLEVFVFLSLGNPAGGTECPIKYEYFL